jgi:hypothetical protein
VALNDQRDGEYNEQQVGEDVAGGQGDELDEALTTLTARVRQDLPVMLKRVALDEIANDDGDEGEAEGASDGD